MTKSVSPTVTYICQGRGERAHPQPHFCCPTWNTVKRCSPQLLTLTCSESRIHELLLNWIKKDFELKIALRERNMKLLLGKLWFILGNVKIEFNHQENSHLIEEKNHILEKSSWLLWIAARLEAGKVTGFREHGNSIVSAASSCEHQLHTEWT